MSSSKRSVASRVHDKLDYSSIVGKVSAIVSQLAGIQLGEKQSQMVESRLKVRMIKLGIETPDAYLAYLETHKDSETQALLSLMTTHHTYFFREFSHFEYLQTEGLAKAIASIRARGDNKLRVWSAACSRGQEVYSIAMFLNVHLPLMAPGMDFEVYGSDVDPESVSVGHNGVYPYRELKSVPAVYLGTNWVRGTGEIAEFVKIKKQLKDKCSFFENNLHKDNPKLEKKVFDIIFCRNVYIYFNEQQIIGATEILLKHLSPSGLLFVDISETLTGLPLPIQSIGPSIYARKTEKPKVVHSQPTVVKSTVSTSSAAKPAPALQVVPSSAAVTPPPQAVVPQILRVVCVDDSSTILVMLKKMLNKDHGFEVVGTASNGREAAELMKSTKADVMTLDIHMPEMDGIEYLKKFCNSNHIPIVMVSTVARDNAELAIQAMELGATDYVEKPNINEFDRQSDEIRSKLKMAALSGVVKASSLALNQSFAKKYTVKNPETKAFIVSASFSCKKRIENVIKAHERGQPPVLFVIEGVGEALVPFVEKMKKNTGKNIKLVTNPTELKPDEYGFYELKGASDPVNNWLKDKKVIFYVMGAFPKWLKATWKNYSWSKVMAEDSSSVEADLAAIAVDMVPATSFINKAIELFEG